MHPFLYWTPRVLSVLFVAFLSLFALDVFSEYQGLAVVLPLFMHLMPSFVLLAFVILAWKYDLVGAAVFVTFAAYYVFMVGFDRHWSWYAFISAPSFVVGVLFFLHWFMKRKAE